MAVLQDGGAEEREEKTLTEERFSVIMKGA